MFGEVCFGRAVRGAERGIRYYSVILQFRTCSLLSVRQRKLSPTIPLPFEKEFFSSYRILPNGGRQQQESECVSINLTWGKNYPSNLRGFFFRSCVFCFISRLSAFICALPPDSRP